MKFKRGDKVWKPEGAGFEGVVISADYDLYGQETYVVQVPGIKGAEPFAGMMHIYHDKQLELLPHRNIKS